MKWALTSRQVRRLEETAVRRGTSIAALMESAGTALADEALRLASPSARFFVVCGRGNNGGDGLVAARKVAEAGRSVTVDLLGGEPESLPPEPKRNYQLLERSAAKRRALGKDEGIGKGDVVIDAMLGTGLNRAPSGIYADGIERLQRWHASGATVVAADLPSGLATDTGQAYEPYVEAEATVTFGALKVGLVLEPGASLSGTVKVADIGLPPPEEVLASEPKVILLEEAEVRTWMPPRSPDSHKGTYGHVLIVAGSAGKTGAAALAGLGALRAGVGLATVACRPEAVPWVLAHAKELMGHSLAPRGALVPQDLDALKNAANGKHAVVIGPGISRGDQTAELFRRFLADFAGPCVIDADGLNAIAGRLDVLTDAAGPIVLTPHPGEMARLVGSTSAGVQQDRVNVARGLAMQRKVVVALKGARTLVAVPDGTVWVNPTGNPGMATGGTGDVLTGLIAALIGQNIEPFAAAQLGVHLHGLAGDMARDDFGEVSLLASDLLDYLPQALRNF
jgi:hydroxyethylthiazole kinase-like uncharacterized protein yjeF